MYYQDWTAPSAHAAPTYRDTLTARFGGGIPVFTQLPSDTGALLQRVYGTIGNHIRQTWLRTCNLTSGSELLHVDYSEPSCMSWSWNSEVPNSCVTMLGTDWFEYLGLSYTEGLDSLQWIFPSDGIYSPTVESQIAQVDSLYWLRPKAKGWCTDPTVIANIDTILSQLLVPNGSAHSNNGMWAGRSAGIPPSK